MKHRIKVTAYENGKKLVGKTYFAEDGCKAIERFESDYGKEVDGCVIVAESKEMVE